MMTGLHRIRSIKCKKCRQTIGWTYVSEPILNSSPKHSNLNRYSLMRKVKNTKKANSLLRGFTLPRRQNKMVKIQLRIIKTILMTIMRTQSTYTLQMMIQYYPGCCRMQVVHGIVISPTEQSCHPNQVEGSSRTLGLAP